MLCGKKKPLTTSILSMGSETDSGLDSTLLDGVENQIGFPAAARFEHITVLMKRVKKGFGFTVTGAKPVRVGRVEDGSPAATAGLQKDDHIIRINGQNVTMLDNESVAKLVKSCEKQVVMDVHRVNRCNQGVSTNGHFVDFDDTCSESSFGSSSGFGSGDHQQQNNMIPLDRMPKVSPWELYHKLKENQQAVQDYDTESEYSYFSDTESCYSCYTCQTVETESSSGSEGQTKSPPNKVCKFGDNPAFDKENVIPKPTKVIVPGKKVGLGGLSYPSSVANQPQRTQIKPKKDTLKTVSQLPVKYHELTEIEVSRQKAIQQLFSCEVNYLRELKTGIRLFHTPLKHNVVSPQHHAILFQNIEKLCALSEKLVSDLSASRVSYTDVSAHYLDSIGQTYSTLLEELCASYEMYCSGVCDSVKMLSELRNYKDFNKYLKSLSTDKSLGSFIQLPVQHVKDMTLKIQQVFKVTATSHSDYEDLQEMLIALRRATTNITQEYVRRSRSNLTNITSPSQYSYANSSSDASSNNKSSTSSVDSEVSDIQNRLLFSEGVKTFQLDNTPRHVIYAGEISYKNKEEWTSVHAILMNDLLLLTKKESDNFLTVLETPVLLQDVSACNNANNHPSEIELIVTSPHCESLGMEPTVYNVRATSVEQKCVWKSLLEQRITLCRTKRELTVSKVAELV